MNKKNLLVIVLLLALIAAVAVAGTLLRQRRPAPVVTVTDPGGLITTLAPEPTGTPSPVPQASAAPAASAQAPAADETAAPQAADEAPRAWLLVTVDNQTYAPYALTRTGNYTINQENKGAKNVVRVTPDSIQMASSTCDNQLCVSEGVVTLDNKASRILGNYIVCLPNGVTLELLSADEYRALLAQQ